MYKFPKIKLTEGDRNNRNPGLCHPRLVRSFSMGATSKINVAHRRMRTHDDDDHKSVIIFATRKIFDLGHHETAEGHYTCVSSSHLRHASWQAGRRGSKPPSYSTLDCCCWQWLSVAAMPGVHLCLRLRGVFFSDGRCNTETRCVELSVYRVLESRKGEVACFPTLNGEEKHATSPFLDSNTQYAAMSQSGHQRPVRATGRAA